MVKVKKQDFVEIEYTGKLKEEGIIFDTSDEKIAKDNGLYNKEHTYGSIKIMVGSSQVLPGLDRFMEGKEPGEYKVSLDPTEGFGKKNAKLLRLIPKSIFIKQQINPMPGLPINIDGTDGIIKTVSGGRCIVDFNHPLSGKVLEYDLKINRIVTDEKEKVSAILELQLKKEEFDLDLVEDKVTITLKSKGVEKSKISGTNYVGLKKPIKDLIEDMIKKFTKVKEVSWKENSEKKDVPVK